ncbi:MAG TPA: ATP-binding protein [Dehalococcoidia bacterium]|nr:ATP-binding protein [Dehalococcoidia bacterium]
MAVSANHPGVDGLNQSPAPGGEPSSGPHSFQPREASSTVGPNLFWRLLPAGMLLALLAGFILVSRPSWDSGISLAGNLVPVHPLSVVVGAAGVLLAAGLGWASFHALGHAVGMTRRGPGPRDDAAAILSAETDPQDVSRRLVEVQETVRREMADYLHGHVQSKLVALSISLGFCQKALRRDPSMAYRMLDRIQEELKRIQDEDLRLVSRELYPAIIKLGLVPAMQSLVDRFKELIDIELIVAPEAESLDRGDGSGLPEKLRLGIYRVTEEALTNVLKHAQASQVRISLDREGPGHLLVSVADNGRGFDPVHVSASQGLLGVADYAQAIGGQVRITSAPGQGVTVGLLLPVPWLQPLETSAPVRAAALPPAA